MYYLNPKGHFLEALNHQVFNLFYRIKPLDF